MPTGKDGGVERCLVYTLGADTQQQQGSGGQGGGGDDAHDRAGQAVPEGGGWAEHASSCAAHQVAMNSGNRTGWTQNRGTDVVGPPWEGAA